MLHTRSVTNQPALFKFALMAMVGVGLYVAREICIPFALAILLSFLLAPVVSRLEKWRIPRVPSVLIVVVLMLALIGSSGWVVLGQLIQLADKLPQYRVSVHEKLEKLHTKPGSTFDRLNRTFEEYANEVQSIASQPATTTSTATITDTATSLPAATAEEPPKAIEVTLAKPKTSGLDVLRSLAFRAVGPVMTLGLVLILTLFMLIQREDVRDRFLRLLGRGQLQLSTKALDDAAGRVSRYLLMQLTVNTIFGICTFAGLYLIGVPNSPLWGLLAASLRFMPYFGVPAAAIPPTLLAFVSAPGFSGVIESALLFVVLEIVICYFVEPWLYGTRTGISPLAILGSALFWAWIWGPVGLLLSTPLTVCLAVMGRHIPSLRFLHVIFGDEPALTPAHRFYQRLLAGDQEEASQIADEALQKSSSLEFYDSVLLPALVLAEQDSHRRELDPETRQVIHRFMNSLIDDVDERTPLKTPADGSHILCIPANDQADEIAARMLAGELRRLGSPVTILPVDTLASESVKAVQDLKPAVVCISAVPPHAMLHARYLSKRLRAAQPQVKLIAGLWLTTEEKSTIEGRLPTPLVDSSATTLAAAVGRISSPREAAGQENPLTAAVPA